MFRFRRTKKGSSYSTTSVQTDSIENYSLPQPPREASPEPFRRISTSTPNTETLTKPRSQTIQFYMEEVQNKFDEARFEKNFSGESDNFDTSEETSRMGRDEIIETQPTMTSERNKVTNAILNQQTRKCVSFQYLEMSDEGIFPSNDGIQLPKLQSEEKMFFKLVKDDDIFNTEKFLQEHPQLNVNCTNYQGITCLHLAIENQSAPMVRLLLMKSKIEIGDSILHAIVVNNMEILELLLDAQKGISPGLEFAGATHSTLFTNHVTPLILAAQLGSYDVIDLLISRGHTIQRPHTPLCGCKDCKSSHTKEDPLYSSHARLSTYRAMTSPAYIVHVSSDPILEAFYLANELDSNASTHLPLATAYLRLKEEVSAFAVDLIGCCRTSQEVETLLKQTGIPGSRYFVLPRLLMAVDYKQKEFVAHPNTQQVLESYWSCDWHGWRNRSIVTKIFVIFIRILITPFILIMCEIAPRHSLVKHWQIPLNKLITHAAAYFVFLTLVFHISNRDKRGEKRGPPNTGAESPLILYVIGYSWSAMRMCLMQGPRRYFGELWNWVDVIMLPLFGLTFAFWCAAALDVDNNEDIYLERKYWSPYDPTLVAEGTFCLATIFAFFKLLILCQLNYRLGPLQVSLGKMTVDIFKYVIVFAIIICAFAAGLARLYQYYDNMVYEDEFGVKTVQVSSFTSLTDTLNTLFWALFCMAPLESADVVIENSYDINNPGKTMQNRHSFTERIGYLCFACFEVISVIVVLNMLIATMSNTFQKVNENVAIEWTFGRTQLYIEYMLQTTLPSPYNLVPTYAALSSVSAWLCGKFTPRQGRTAKCSLAYCCYFDRDVEASVQKEYPALISVLVQRYFRSKSTVHGNIDKGVQLTTAQAQGRPSRTM